MSMLSVCNNIYYNEDNIITNVDNDCDLGNNWKADADRIIIGITQTLFHIFIIIKNKMITIMAALTKTLTLSMTIRIAIVFITIIMIIIT